MAEMNKRGSSIINRVDRSGEPATVYKHGEPIAEIRPLQANVSRKRALAHLSQVLPYSGEQGSRRSDSGGPPARGLNPGRRAVQPRGYALVLDNSAMMRWLFDDGSTADRRYAVKVLDRLGERQGTVFAPYVWVYRAWNRLDPSPAC